MCGSAVSMCVTRVLKNRTYEDYVKMVATPSTMRISVLYISPCPQSCALIGSVRQRETKRVLFACSLCPSGGMDMGMYFPGQGQQQKA